MLLHALHDLAADLLLRFTELLDEVHVVAGCGSQDPAGRFSCSTGAATASDRAFALGKIANRCDLAEIFPLFDLNDDGSPDIKRSFAVSQGEIFLAVAFKPYFYQLGQISPRNTVPS